MLKWLNILAITYLAIAPGMDVGRLIHSVDLCRFTDPAGHTQTAEPSHNHFSHSHAPKPKPEPPKDDCPHLHSVIVHASAMAVVHIKPVLQAALPVLNPPVLELQAPAGACRLTDDNPRPPPGLPRVGITILVV